MWVSLGLVRFRPDKCSEASGGRNVHTCRQLGVVAPASDRVNVVFSTVLEISIL